MIRSIQSDNRAPYHDDHRESAHPAWMNGHVRYRHENETATPLPCTVPAMMDTRVPSGSKPFYITTPYFYHRHLRSSCCARMRHAFEPLSSESFYTACVQSMQDRPHVRHDIQKDGYQFLQHITMLLLLYIKAEFATLVHRCWRRCWCARCRWCWSQTEYGSEQLGCHSRSRGRRSRTLLFFAFILFHVHLHFWQRHRRGCTQRCQVRPRFVDSHARRPLAMARTVQRAWQAGIVKEEVVHQC